MKASELIDLFIQSFTEGWGYIWGKSGQVWTARDQSNATRETTIKYGAQWIGKRVSDCSGMFVWAFKQYEMKIFHGSNTIWKSYCAKQGKLMKGKRADGYKLRPGTAVFLTDANNNRHHIGLYIGEGMCIEAKGTRYGVVKSDISHWDEWGELKDVDYSEYPDEKEGEPMNPTLRRSDRGEDVKRLQDKLNEYGYRLTVDGVFGSGTEHAVKAFQQGHFLTVDGIVGPKTWDALYANNGGGGDDDGQDDGDVTNGVYVPRSELETMRINARYIVNTLDKILDTYE